jgi:hypothetical protein
MQMERRLIPVVILMLTLILGCGGDDPASPDPNTGQTVGPAGGTVEGDGGRATLTIPAGALDAEVAITVSSASGVPVDAGMITASLYEFGPDGLDFDVPVPLTITYDPADIPAGVDEADLKLCKVTGNTWLPLAGSTVDTGAHTVSAELNSFSAYGPGDPAPAGEQSIVITPDDVPLTIFNGQDFTLELTGVDSGDVVWRILEHPFGGEVDDDGHYVGPGWLGVFHVIVALDGNPAVADTATVRMAHGEYICVNHDLIEYDQGVTFDQADIYDAQLDQPWDAEWYGGFVWVSDTDNHVLRRYSDAGEYLGAIGKWWHCWPNEYGGYESEARIGWISRAQSAAEIEFGCGIGMGSYGDELGAFHEPYCIAFDPGGLMYVMDSDNDRVQILSNDGAAQSCWGESGDTPGTFESSAALAVDAVYLYSISSWHRLQKFSHGGDLVWHRDLEWGVDVNFPIGLTVDADGNMYLIDQSYDRLTVFNPQGEILFTWGDEGESQYTDDCMLNNPRDIELDADGNIYIIDNKSVAILSPTGNLLGRVAEGGTGIGIDTAKNLYIVTLYPYEVHKWNSVNF